ncbi:phosphate ABC transporter substrate-binding protein [Roseateles oligotrophus]|uniref:Phosphate ABC transporter substrate-binding protein n=1 Tax=Roseateles oligotrophus TaxID=1769250 RepID=A0ABT2YK77_9BURK|nr:phosphate ABC transporter substrate-binding protein [Roseateles oligotrophus]MCV2370461.1 phosphate ABC transporter substrate-binding protein [Roseateles oligotrophus]
MKRHSIQLGLACALGLAALQLVHAGPLVVIVAAQSNAPKISVEQASAIFMGSAKSFPNGEKAVPVDQSMGSPAFAEFYSVAAGRTEAQVKAYWSRMVFTGKGSPPQDGGDAAAVKKLVAANPNLVGYVDASLVDASVKVLTEIK